MAENGGERRREKTLPKLLNLVLSGLVAGLSRSVRLPDELAVSCVLVELLSARAATDALGEILELLLLTAVPLRQQCIDAACHDLPPFYRAIMAIPLYRYS